MGGPKNLQRSAGVDLIAVAGIYVMVVAMILAMAEETVPPGKEGPF